MRITFDEKLVLSNEEFGDVIKKYADTSTFDITSPPHASRDVLLEFAKLAYKKATFEDKHFNKEETFKNKLKDWELLTTAENWNGYYGIAFWNPKLGHVAIAHRGTDGLFAAYTDFMGIFLNCETDHLFSAITFVEKVASVIRIANQERENHSISLSITGHSLGGWLTSVSTFTVKYLQYNSIDKMFTTITKGLHAHAVTFDSPGCYPTIHKIRNEYDHRNCRSMFTRELDITTYVVEQNIINITNQHVGRIHLLSKEKIAPKQSVISSSFCNFKSHKLENFTFDSDQEEFIVKDLLQGIGEFLDYKADGIQDRNDIVKFNKNTNDQRIFSREEIKFLHIWSNLRDTSIKLNSEDFKFLNMPVENIEMKLFKIEDGLIICDKEKDLESVITRTKQIVRWHYSKVMYALKKQLSLFPTKIYRFLEKTFLDSVRTMNLDCKDYLALEEFFESENRVMCIETDDIHFEVARLRNLLTRIKENRDWYTFLQWKNLIEINCHIEIDKLYETADFRDDDLLIIFCDENTNTEENLQLWKRMWENMQKSENKKMIIVNFPFTHPELEIYKAENIKFEDLTDESIQKLLDRKIILFGDKKLSLKEFMKTDTLNTETLQTLISSKIKDLVTNEKFCITIKNTFIKLEESNVLFSKVETEVNVENMSRLLRSGALLVISGDAQGVDELVEQGGVDVVLTGGNGEQVFRLECRRNRSRIVYWVEANCELFILKEIYNKSFYLHRCFHNKMKISIEKLINEKHPDVFIIETELTEKWLEEILSSKLRDTFKENITYYVNVNEEVDSNKPVHRLKLERIGNGGKYQLVWKSSEKSIEGLRPFVTHDESQAVEEENLCFEDHRLIVIADEPGMGKTTTLTSISQLIATEYYTIRIDLRNFQKQIDDLPPKMNLQAVKDFLVKCKPHNAAEDQEEYSDIKRCLLEYCLKLESKRKVFLLIDGFDEIKYEGSHHKGRKNIVRMLKYLLKKTSANIIVTTRLFPKDYLENELLQFATVFKKVSEGDQMNYLVNFWSTYLQGTQRELQDTDEKKLQDWTKLMYKESGDALGKDIKKFMGIPLQLRMIAEIYLKSIQSVLENRLGRSPIKSALELYNSFIDIKLNIYMNDKTESTEIRGFEKYAMKTMNRKLHRLLGFQIFNEEYAKENLNMIKAVNNYGWVLLIRLSKFGLIQFFGDGTFEFVHRTFAEFFCADLIIQWLRQEDADYKFQPMEELCLKNVFLKPEFNVVRIFLNDCLTKDPLSREAFKKISQKIMGKVNESTNISKFRDRNNQSALHVALEENKIGIINIFVNDDSKCNIPKDNQYLSYLATRDFDGRTALFLAVDTKERDEIRNEMINYVDNSCLNAKNKLLVSTFFGKKMISEESHNERFFWNAHFDVQKIGVDENKITKHLSDETKDIFTNIAKIIKDERSKFVDYVKKYSSEEIIKYFNEIKDEHVRYYLPLVMDSEGETAINIAAGKGYKNVVELFGNDDVLMSCGRYDLTPLHYAAKGWSADNTTVQLTEHHLEVITFIANRTNIITSSSFINCKDSRGRTPLLLAASEGHTNAVKCLLEIRTLVVPKDSDTAVEIKASVDTKDSDGNTPLIMASLNGHTKAVQVLLSHNADSSLKNDKNNTALDYAKNGKHLAIVDLLENAPIRVLQEQISQIDFN